MDNRPNEPRYNNNQLDIDVISFERRKRAAEIIQKEEAERERRRREQLKRRKAERMRQAQIARMKGYALLGITALGALLIIIGIIVGIVKAVGSGNDKKPDETTVNVISEEETKLVNDFAASQSYIYTGNENDFLTIAEKMLSDITINGSSSGIPAVTKSISDYGILSERYMYVRNEADFAAFKEAVKNVPIFSNGYIWSETDSMKSSVTGGYLYDTNTSYILAVANICLIEGNTSFLSEVDTDSRPLKDSSQGLSVSNKLEMAINYLFDNNTLDGGIKYDAQYTSLCYIHTAANHGSSTGTPSNRWHNFKFGYLDAYCNISFNKAMRALVDLYTLQGLTDEASKYKTVADKNAAEFSGKFWDSANNRFVGSFDKNGNAYDYGFVFVNLEAIDAGMASSEQISHIFSWLDGEREISTDTSKGNDIYSFGFAPRNTTVEADDKLWDTLGGSVILSGDGGYGMYYLNGGASLSTSYYDICARYKSGLYDSASSRMNALVNEYKKADFVSADTSDKLDIAGNPLSGLAPVALLKAVFGVDSDGLYLTVNPNLSIIPHEGEGPVTADDLGYKYGIKNIRFGTSSYGFLYKGSTLFVTCDRNTAVRMNLGGLEANCKYDLIKVQSGTVIADSVPLVSDENGIVSIIADFGADSYIKIQKAK